MLYVRTTQHTLQLDIIWHGPQRNSSISYLLVTVVPPAEIAVECSAGLPCSLPGLPSTFSLLSEEANMSKVVVENGGFP